MASLFNKVESLQACNFITPTQMFSCEYCETFKNSFFIETSGCYFLKVQFQTIHITFKGMHKKGHEGL